MNIALKLLSIFSLISLNSCSGNFVEDTNLNRNLGGSLDQPEVSITGPVHVEYGDDIVLSLEMKNATASYTLTATDVDLDGNSTTRNLMSSIYTTIGLETYTSIHKAEILFTQALDDPTGGGNQATWLREYIDAVNAIPANANTSVTTVPTGGHAAFANNPILQASIRTFIGSNAGNSNIAYNLATIVPTDGQTHAVNSTSYPVMGELYVPVSLAASSIDVVILFHGTITEGGSSTIAEAAEQSLHTFLDPDNLNIRDKIIFSAAYPQDHISNTRQYNLPGVGLEEPTFLMGDNLPYARAAVGWVQNSLDGFIATQGGSKTIGDVYLFGHSQGGKLVGKINTIDTNITGVIANAPGPIQFDQTCWTAGTATSCQKISAIHGAPSGLGEGIGLSASAHTTFIDTVPYGSRGATRIDYVFRGESLGGLVDKDYATVSIEETNTNDSSDNTAIILISVFSILGGIGIIFGIYIYNYSIPQKRAPSMSEKSNESNIATTNVLHGSDNL